MVAMRQAGKLLITLIGGRIQAERLLPIVGAVWRLPGSRGLCPRQMLHREVP